MARKTKSTDEQTLIAVSGPATVRVVSELRSQLLAALDAGLPIVIDLTAADRVDLSFVQLLLSLERTASARGVHLALRGDPEVVSSAAGGAREVQRLWAERTVDAQSARGGATEGACNG